MDMTEATAAAAFFMQSNPGMPSPGYLTVMVYDHTDGAEINLQFNEDVNAVKTWARSFGMYPHRSEYETYVSQSVKVKFAHGDADYQVKIYTHIQAS